jgi:hypothetical protein
MRQRHREIFTTIKTEGNLLPIDLLHRTFTALQKVTMVSKASPPILTISPKVKGLMKSLTGPGIVAKAYGGPFSPMQRPFRRLMQALPLRASAGSSPFSRNWNMEDS